ncbi:MAG: hypothetical protein E7J10_07745 [Streptococcus parasanguinis]|uniref:hypothetical protein n=1 Tax=Streptococcus parasanguinis TaxID=1318 RepID=UPI001011D7D4|nr:hypothetical protein [Streptococcus parasanguinis]MDU4524209.1 hypothetical protein [Streptococcus parasanguinis]RXX19250.1 hypothetical protein DF218_02990 [Streptococcus parasanguinis]
MVRKQKINGRVYNISLNEQTLQKGWYLIVTDQNQEYLVKRNCSLSTKRSFAIYQTNYSFIKHTHNQNVRSRTGLSYVGATLVIASLICLLTPYQLWLGPTIKATNYLQGMVHLLSLAFAVTVSFIFVAVFRKMKLKAFLKGKKADLKYIGRVKTLTPLKVTKEGVDFW